MPNVRVFFGVGGGKAAGKSACFTGGDSISGVFVDFSIPTP